MKCRCLAFKKTNTDEIYCFSCNKINNNIALNLCDRRIDEEQAKEDTIPNRICFYEAQWNRENHC